MSDHPAEMTDVERVRLRRWAGAYRRLMTGGLGKEAHTAGVDEFADASGEYPFIMADDIDCLLDALEAAEGQIEVLKEADAYLVKARAENQRLREGIEALADRMAGEDEGLFVDRMIRLDQAAAELRALLSTPSVRGACGCAVS